MRSGVIQTSKQTCIAKGMRCSMWKKIRDKMNRVKDKIVNIVIVLISVIATVVIIIKCLHEGIPNAFDAIDIIALASMALVFTELRQNKKINEAQLIKDINSEFINNLQLSRVEQKLEMYYDQYKHAKTTDEREKLHLDLCMDIGSDERQNLVNYLVHLEAVASLVNNEAIRLDSVNDLIAYRFFIAVNNRDVQTYELLPFKDYYRGCYILYKRWKDVLKRKKMEIPMNEQGEKFFEKGYR